MLHRLLVALVCAAGCILILSPAAKAQDLFFDTQIVSLDLTGTAPLPLGPAGEMIDTTINFTKATDHNSSRSNKTSSIAKPDNPDDTDDVDPDDLDGKTFDLFSSIDLRFSVAFADADLDTDFDPVLGNAPVATTPDAGQFELLGQPSSFEFAAAAPDFGMLLSGGTRIQTHRGHVTVLKIAFGGGGGDIDLKADGLELIAVPGSDGYKTLPGGVVEHTFGVTMNLSGTYAGNPFLIEGLSGSMVERGTLFNNVVPEPSSVLLALGGLALVAASRRRRA